MASRAFIALAQDCAEGGEPSASSSGQGKASSAKEETQATPAVSVTLSAKFVPQYTLEEHFDAANKVVAGMLKVPHDSLTQIEALFC